MKIGICIPSRGLVHSRTMETVLLNLEDVEHETKFFFAHDKFIPDAQNDITKRALKWRAYYIWYVEEDNIIPPGTLRAMLKAIRENECGVVAVDYPVGSKNYSTIATRNGKPMWCGFGCTLVRAFSLSGMEQPWFRTDISYRITNKETMEMEEYDAPSKYGGHDIHFGVMMGKLGIPIYQLPNVVCGHAKMEVWGGRQTNTGPHEISVFDTIDNKQDY